MVLRYNDMAYVSGSSVDQMALVAVSSRLPLLGFYGSSQVNHVSDLRQECGLGFVYLWFPRPSFKQSRTQPHFRPPFYWALNKNVTRAARDRLVPTLGVRVCLSGVL